MLEDWKSKQFIICNSMKKLECGDFLEEQKSTVKRRFPRGLHVALGSMHYLGIEYLAPDLEFINFIDLYEIPKFMQLMK